jgi:hypothetical protein
MQSISVAVALKNTSVNVLSYNPWLPAALSLRRWRSWRVISADQLCTQRDRARGVMR